MHSNVTIKNVSWPHFSWPTLYTASCFVLLMVHNDNDSLKPFIMMYITAMIYAEQGDDDDDDDDETGCQTSCSPDAALRNNMASQQSSIDSMQEQITRMRDLIRSMTSGTVHRHCSSISSSGCR